MSKSNSKVIAITMGDPAGIGAEVTAKALLRMRFPRGVSPLIIGNRDIWSRINPSRTDAPVLLHMASRPRSQHVPGVPTPDSGRDSLLYIEKAVELLKAGKVQGLVTAPVSKESISRFVPGFKGHTTYLAEAFGRKDVEMLFVAGKMRLLLVTRHISLKEVPSKITTAKVSAVIRSTDIFLRERFSIRAPRIAVLGLNPHAGEGGTIGREEIKAIIPAIDRLRSGGLDIHGPFPADTFFEPRNCRGYDLVVAMYHDQALTVLKAQYFDRLVNLTVGLPFIRTSPAHGTAFGIAGKGVADEGSMLSSIKLAASL